MEKQKVLVLYNKIFHYRVPIFNILSEKYDLTVAYSFGSIPDTLINFKVIKLPVWKIKRFIIHKQNIKSLCDKYNTIIVYGDISWLKYSTLPFFINRKFKVIFWTIGVSATYNKEYDKNNQWDKIRDFFYKKADAIIFYTDYPINKNLNRGYTKEKMFVAPNTVHVENDNIYTDRIQNCFIFIGTLYIQKGISSLLNNYKTAYSINNKIFPLYIIGDGPEKNLIEQWVNTNGLKDNILIVGAIYDDNILKQYFKNAIACISPFQSGLSVLKSMGYGVPFITMNNSITGGERLNITHNINGILYNEENELSSILLDIMEIPDKYVEMGKNAFFFYNNQRTPLKMAKGIIDSIEYVSNK